MLTKKCNRGLQCGQGRKAPEEYNQQYKKTKESPYFNKRAKLMNLPTNNSNSLPHPQPV